MKLNRRALPLILVLLTCLPAAGQEVLGTSGICRQFGQDVARAAPTIREGRTHWIVAVDCSGSMLGKLDPLKAMLQEWLKLTVVPGDRITLVPFSKTVLSDVELEVGDDPSVTAGKLNPSLRVHPGRGTALDAARRHVQELAAKDAAKDPNWAYVTVILSDRDDTDGPETATPSPEGEEQQNFYEVSADGQKRVGLRSLVRAVAGKTPAPAGGVRRIPLSEPREDLTPGSDPDAHLRHTLSWAPLAPLLAALLLTGWLFAESPGLLLGNPSGAGVSLPWWIGRRRTVPVHVSRNRLGFCLEPAREGIEDRLVALASMANPWAPGRWRARLQATEGQTLGELEQLELAPGQHPLVVRDRNGVVADRLVQVDVRGGTLTLWRATLALLGSALVLWLLLPMVPTRPPTPAVSRTVTEEPL